MENKQNKLGTMPIGPLLVKMGVPMMVSMLVQALYNIVDSMFVARISENALTAVSLAFPFQLMMSSIAIGTGIGTNAFVSRTLGMQDIKGAEKAANVQCFLSFCYTVVFMVFGVLASHGFFAAQTDITEIVNYGTDYMTIVCLFCFGMFFATNFEKLLVALGCSTQSMISQAAGAIFNIIFDWLLIFGIGPFPELGIKGAAIATVMGQFLSAGLAYYYVCSHSGGMKIRIRNMLPNMKTVKGIYAVGIPSAITVGVVGVMSFFMNQILLTFSTTATALFGIWGKLQSFGFMPVFGLNNGSVAIYSYNYGAGNLDRIKKTKRLSIIMGLSVTTTVMLIYMLIPRTLLNMYDASDYMMSIGVKAFRTCCLSMPFGALSVIVSNSFQSFGRSGYTLIVSLCRQVIILIPTAWLLSLSGRLELVWFAPVIAECLTAIVSVILETRVRKLLTKKFEK